MALTRTWPIDAGFPNALDLRKTDSGSTPREGVFPDPITVATAGIAYGNGGWNVGARPFVATVRRGTAPFALTYGTAKVANDSAGTAWTIGGAPGSGSRIDLLWIRVTDPTQADSMSGAPTDGPAGMARAVPVYGVTAGTASGTPVAPTLPAGALEIARVTTPTGAASIAGSTIVQTYAFAHVLGSDLYVRTASALPTVAYRGEFARALDSGWLYRHNGTAWVAVETEWVAVDGGSFASGWGGPATGPWGAVATKRDGDVGALIGVIAKSSAWGGDELILTLPDYLRPSTYQEAYARVGAAPVFVAVLPNGQVRTTTAGSGAIVAVSTHWLVD